MTDKLRGPIFYKESHTGEEQIQKLKRLYDMADGVVKDQIEYDIKLLSYGIKGEDNVAFELANSGMPLLILRDLNLEHKALKAQIDFLIISRKVNIVVECKNLFGNIEINNRGEFIRTLPFRNGNKREGIYSPITQNQRHINVLKKIIVDHKSNLISKFFTDKFFDDNFKSIVVLANSKTIINMRYAKKDIKKQIIRADQLIEYIRRIERESTNSASSDKMMYQMARRYLAYHTYKSIDYTKKYEKVINDEREQIVAADNDTNINEALYNKLREYRYNRSKAERIKPYYIYTNAEMENLIHNMPRSIKDIASISGFGKIKCEKYGQDILDIINSHRATNN